MSLPAVPAEPRDSGPRPSGVTLALRVAATALVAIALLAGLVQAWRLQQLRGAGVQLAPGQTLTGALTLHRAVTRIAAARTVDDLRASVRLARDTLRADPLEYRALVLLGEIAALSRQSDGALRVFEAAARRTRRDLALNARLADEYIRRGRPAEAVPYVDMLLYAAGPSQPLGFQFLSEGLQRADVRAAIAPVLERGPVWRTSFLAYVLTNSPQPDPLLILYDGMIAKGVALERRETTLIVERLARLGRYEQAYLLWLELVGEADQDLGGVNNADFERVPAPAPFDWQLSSERAGSAEVIATGGDGQVLEVSFDEDSFRAPVARQLLLLPAGAYRLRASLRSEGETAPNGLVWSVRCADAERNAAPAGATAPVEATLDWRTVEAEVVVPVANCAAQWLALETDATVSRGTGRVWFDKVRVDRLR